MSIQPHEVVARIVKLTDRGGLSLGEARRDLADAMADNADDSGHSVYEPEYASAYAASADRFIEACDELMESSPSAIALAQDLRYHKEWEITRLDRYHGVNREIREFDQWHDDVAATRAVIRWCVVALYVGNDRVVEDAARRAGQHSAVAALRAIVPVEEPDRFTILVGHGTGMARDLLEEMDPSYLALVVAHGQDQFSF